MICSSSRRALELHHDGVALDVVPTVVRGAGDEPLEAHCVEIEPHVFLVGVYEWF